MSGYRSNDFRHDCRHHGCYMDVRAPDWEWMRPCFPRRILPSDVDGMVEIGGHFLFLEQKGEGVSIEGGQKEALKRLAQHPTVTVLIFRPAGADCFERLRYDGSRPNGWQRRSRDELGAEIAQWALRATHCPTLPGKETP